MAEIFIVEGDSAGGSAKQGRDRRHQAILPLRGKILNVEKARFDKILSSQEIATLITALGCGVGEDHFDIEKLRYHRIVVMTDADVDGSHIRTLLLTFFYRQMPELVRRGHLYIAQPPLFKVKKGKHESYLKAEQDLDQFIIDAGIGQMKLLDARDRLLEGDELRQIVLQTMRYERHFSKLRGRGDARLLEALTVLDGDLVSGLLDAPVDVYRQQTQRMAEYMARRYPHAGELTFERGADMHLEGDSVTSRVIVESMVEGIPSRTVIDAPVVRSKDFLEMRSLKRRFREVGTAPYRVQGLEEEAGELKLDRLTQLAAYVEERGRKGLSIQRYKGLGEMNPEQLWETTMDPERRTLLQVRVDDQMEADDIFTVLMGDQVEPRRDFIATNALNARNLDI